MIWLRQLRKAGALGEQLSIAFIVENPLLQSKREEDQRSGRCARRTRNKGTDLIFCPFVSGNRNHSPTQVEDVFLLPNISPFVCQRSSANAQDFCLADFPEYRRDIGLSPDI